MGKHCGGCGIRVEPANWTRLVSGVLLCGACATLGPVMPCGERGCGPRCDACDAAEADDFSHAPSGARAE